MSFNVNKVFFGGNLTRDPELRTTQGGTQICKFGIAANTYGGKDAQGNARENVCYVDVVVFGTRAEVIAKHFKKGQPIYVEGRLTFSTWKDKQHGETRSKLELFLLDFQFVGGRPEQGGASGTGSLKTEPVDMDDDENSIPF